MIMNFHAIAILIALLWTIIGIGIISYLFSMMRSMAEDLGRVNILLTVMANKQGATQSDIDAALGKK
jgi:hypothetical protein